MIPDISHEVTRSTLALTAKNLTATAREEKILPIGENS